MKKTESRQKAPLHRRLEAWDNAVAAIRTNCKGRNWLHYTAAAGAALAMATDASAGAIPIGPVSAGTLTGGPGGSSAAQAPFTVAGAHFQLSVFNGFTLGGNPFQGAFMTGLSTNAQILETAFDGIKKLASGSAISGGAGNWANGYHWLKAFQTEFFSSGPQRNPFGQFQSGVPAFAGIRVITNGTPGNVIGAEYGWVKLEYTDDTAATPIPNFVELITGEYQSTPNTAITTPTSEAPVPEPGTIALSLLALGAVGVLALRRKKTAVSA